MRVSTILESSYLVVLICCMNWMMELKTSKLSISNDGAPMRMSNIQRYFWKGHLWVKFKFCLCSKKWSKDLKEFRPLSLVGGSLYKSFARVLSDWLKKIDWESGVKVSECVCGRGTNFRCGSYS